MNRFAQTLCAVTLLLLLAGCQSTANGVTSQVTPDNPQIFRVGHEVYTLNDFSKRMEQDIGPAIENLMSQGQTREQIEQLANDQQIRESVFESMVQEALLSQYARSQGIGVDAASVDSAVLAQAAPFDPASPFASLTTKRVSEAQTELVLAVLVKNTRADMFHARMIKLSSEADADQALADIKSGASFEALVAQRSKDPQSSEKKGDLGWIPLGNEPTEL
ncbi:MAG: hypothetical protein HGA65_20715, partial [Oscillochloris sp.]|nr:hypothetical protein [Oscillochloris sp.]